MKNIIIGNWKMNPLTFKEAEALYRSVKDRLGSSGETNVVICPPAIYLTGLLSLGGRKIMIGAQNCDSGNVGSKTGGISVGMLKELGASYVMVGHSEIRAQGEIDSEINTKLKSALSAKLHTVLCVGESHRDESGDYLTFIKQQIVLDLGKIKKSLMRNLIVAYEPVWAIGKDAVGPDAPGDAIEVAIFIRKIISEMFGREIGLKVPVLYGGSVDPKNCLDYLRDGVINGFLIGRASLNPKKFSDIIKAVNDHHVEI